MSRCLLSLQLNLFLRHQYTVLWFKTMQDITSVWPRMPLQWLGIQDDLNLFAGLPELDTGYFTQPELSTGLNEPPIGRFDVGELSTY